MTTELCAVLLRRGDVTLKAQSEMRRCSPLALCAALPNPQW